MSKFFYYKNATFGCRPNPKDAKEAPPGTVIKTRADLSITIDAETFLIDVTTTGAMPKNSTTQDACTIGFMATQRETEKIKQTKNWITNPGVTIVAFAFDIHGAAAPGALEFKSKIQNKVEAKTAQEKRMSKRIHPSRFWEQININVIKGCYAACHNMSYGGKARKKYKKKKQT